MSQFVGEKETKYLKGKCAGDSFSVPFKKIHYFQLLNYTN